MALFAIARQLQRINRHSRSYHLVNSFRHSPVSFSTFGPQLHHFCWAFYRTGLPSLHFFLRNLSSSTLQPCVDQIISGAINFSSGEDGPHENYRFDVGELVDALKKAEPFSSEEEATVFLEDLGVEPNEDLVHSTIWALKDEWRLAFWVFKWGEKWGCAGEKIGALMIWVLGNSRKFNTAWCLIRDLHRSSVGTHWAMLAMIDRYAAANDPGGAIKTFQFMEKFKMTPDMEAFHALLNALCKHGNIEEAEEYMLLNKKLFPLDTVGFNTILNGWCNISVDIYEAKRVWREMSKCCIVPNTNSYEHMISCFSKVGNLFDSLRLYDEMKKRGHVPGLKVYNSLIYVLTHENCLNEALKILDKMKEAGAQPDSVTFNSLICPLCEAKKLGEAKSVLARMILENVSPTIETYHAFLEGASVEGTLEVCNLMVKAGLGPNQDTFLLIYGKFFELKQPGNALKIWVEMKQYGVVPDSAHYGILVEGLATCGFLLKAREFYDEMKYNGFLDNPKLKKLLNGPGPVQGARGQKCQEPVRSLRNTGRGTNERHHRSSPMGRKNCARPSRQKGIFSIFDII